MTRHAQKSVVDPDRIRVRIVIIFPGPELHPFQPNVKLQ